jgi:hypothetical protein
MVATILGSVVAAMVVVAATAFATLSQLNSLAWWLMVITAALAAGGGLAGRLQVPVLRDRLCIATNWTLVTALCWPIGTVIGAVQAMGIGGVLYSFVLAGAGTTAIGLLCGAAGGAISGAVIGLGQWIVLRRHFSDAGL